jgi:WXG100 family type VII secretion target
MADFTATDHQLMAQTAKNFDDTNQQMMSDLTTLKGKVASLQGAWIGRGAISFNTTMESWARSQENIQRLLGETAGLIRSAGTHYAATDDNAATRLGNQGGGEQLPL